jgi:dihydrolipoamide dehydrogenase
MDYDVIILGGGPGGYIAAERTAARGHKTLLIEEKELGGVCLNEGCIPTKTLLNSAKLYTHGLEAEQFGVSFENPRFDLSAAMKWKEKVIQTLVKGVAYQMKRHGVEVVKGRGIFVDRNTIEAEGTRYTGKNIIIATGSSPMIPPIPGAEGDKVLTSSEILQIEKMPGRLAVIGGGVIGMEFASFFSSFGKEVHVIEMLDEILPTMDGELSKLMRREMKGTVEFHLGSKVVSIDGGKVTYETGGETQSLEADIVLMSVGRRPNVENNGFEKIGLNFTPKGVVVDEKMRTNLPGIYAVGDVNGKSLLAHSASRMGDVAAAVISGGDDRMRYHAIPWVVYTQPEAAGTGLTEAEAEAKEIAVESASLPMRANGRFLAENGNKSGICKVVTAADTGVLLGVHLLGGVSSEIIYGASAMIEAELRVKDIREVVFPHPTVAEVIKDTLWEL